MGFLPWIANAPLWRVGERTTEGACGAHVWGWIPKGGHWSSRRLKAALRRTHTCARARPCVFLRSNDEHVRRKCEPDRRAPCRTVQNRDPSVETSHTQYPRKKIATVETWTMGFFRELRRSASASGSVRAVKRSSWRARDERREQSGSVPKREKRDRSTNPHQRTLSQSTCILSNEGDRESKRASERTSRENGKRSRDTMTSVWGRIGNLRVAWKKSMGAKGFVLERGRH